MKENYQDNSSKMKLVKGEEKIKLNSKNKKSILFFVKKLLNIFGFFGYIFLSLINKIKYCLSKCSILIQFPLSLIPISIIMILAIFFIHYYFYSELYVFNFSKALKDEFLDLYITKINDFKEELTSTIVKDIKIDIENQLFFQVYFKELATAGLMNEDKNFFPSFSDNPGSTSLFSKLNNIKNTDEIFDITENPVLNRIEDRFYDKLGDFAKIYYYIFPHIWYGSLMSNTFINQSFFVAYEEMDAYSYDPQTWEIFTIKGIVGDFLFFRYPKQIKTLAMTNNFTPNHYLLNPFPEYYNVEKEKYLNDNYYYINWFKFVDYDFRSSINNSKYNLVTNISFAHLNQESEGDINKTFISYAQQYIREDNREYIFNIIFFWNQTNLKDEDNDYTIFILKDNFTDLLGDINLTERFSDNQTYTLSISDETEYALSDIDFLFFHLNLFDNKYNFYANGILFDSFNLEYFYDYSKAYSTGKKIEHDFKIYMTLYLYKNLFQNVKYKKVKKNREETFLYNFKKGKKIKQICEKINFNSYRNYLSNSGINCWNKRTKKYYNAENFLYTSLVNDSNIIEPIYPYCNCLPLYCLKNYENLNENLDKLEFADDINLPNKCQNILLKEKSLTSNDEYLDDDNINDLIDISSNLINYDYIKFEYMELNQIPGYFLFIISQIKSTGEIYIHTYYKLVTKIEITILIIVILFIASILSIIIIYINMKNYSLIISNFKKKFEFYVYHSLNEVESHSSNYNNFSKYIIKKEDKKDEQLINFFNINDNILLDDLFFIFSQTYNVCKKDIEKLYSFRKHKSKNHMKLNIMREKNELFGLLSSFCLYAPCFKLNLNFDYNMYEHSIIIKKYNNKYNNYVEQLENVDKKSIRLTKNILIELISTECICDYGLITNFNFGYITDIKKDSKKYSIKYTVFQNIKNEKKKNDIKNEQTKKLVLKGKNVLLDIFEFNFEEDDYMNYNKLNSAFNFFLINSYYKYYGQIAFENNIE